MKKIIFTLVLLISVFGLYVQEKKPATEICHIPNLVKDTSKKNIKLSAMGIINGDSVKNFDHHGIV